MIFRGQQKLTFLHSSNALLVAAVHVKMKLVENTLNNSLTCKHEISDKTLANCSPYLTALMQVINILETQRSYKTKVNPENLKL